MESNEDKKDDEKRDPYRLGRSWNPLDWARPPQATREEHDEFLREQQEIYRRIQECNRGAFGTSFLKHTYLRDAHSGETVGKGNLGTVEAGPEKDACTWLLGDKGQQKSAFRKLRAAVEAEEKMPNGPPGVADRRSWAPGVQDCHTLKDHAVREAGAHGYTPRVGGQNTRPLVTPEEDARVRAELHAAKQEKARATGKPVKEPLWWKKEQEKKKDGDE